MNKTNSKESKVSKKVKEIEVGELFLFRNNIFAKVSSEKTSGRYNAVDVISDKKISISDEVLVSSL